MRVAGIGLLMAIFAAGCAMQPGSEGDADWTPPSEVTARPGAGAPTATVLTASVHGAVTSGPDNGGSDPQGSGSSAPQQHPDPAPWITPGSGTPSDSTPGGQQGGTTGHPDPAPWNPTRTLAGSTGNGGSSASAPGDPGPVDGHVGLPLVFQR